MKRFLAVGIGAMGGGLILWALMASATGATPAFAAASADRPAAYRSPQEARYSPDGRFLAVSDRTAGIVAIIDAAAGKVAREVAVSGKPTGIAWAADGTKVYVAEWNAGTVAEIDPAAGKILRRLPAGLRPMGVAVAPKRGLLVVANTVTNDLSVVDLASGKEKGRIRLPREPYFVAVTPDETLAVVGNLLPAGSAADPQNGAAVSLVDLASMKSVADVRLPGGSTAVRGVAVSPDGKWAYAVHTVGRTTLPTTQLERGWVNTNAFTLIDLGAKAAEATLLLDRLSEGAADPWGVVLAKDGKTMWVSLAGVHQVARVDLGGLHALLKGEGPLAQPPADKSVRAVSDTWVEIKKDPEKRKFLVNDLAALYAAGLLDRMPLAGKGPRGIDLSPDGKTMAVALYYSASVILADPQTGKASGAIRLGPDGMTDPARRGEQIFHDAGYCFQHWLSCATCHPEDARVDGLNWDLLNDGLGNPKNARSLLGVHKRSPVMSHGVRASMEVAVVAGFKYIQFHEPQPDEIAVVQAYLRSLEPMPSPYLAAKGELSDAAQRGKKLFESAKTGCAKCHLGPTYTDQKLYDVGTRHPLDQKSEVLTPTLIEMYRTGPYLHMGQAVTLEEVLTTFNAKGLHGTTKDLTKEERADLVVYLLSL
jgi:DNA-binding beta-propeller fold protein YncE/cytochrome c1